RPRGAVNRADPDVEGRWVTIPVNTKAFAVTPYSTLNHGHWFNPGLVAAGGRLYGQVEGSLVALDQETGAPQWVYPLEKGAIVRSLASTRDVLFASLNNSLIALRLEDGTLLWQQSMPGGGTLSIANGRLFLAMG